MNTWKTPEYYIPEVYSCDYNTRKTVGCTEQFYQMGFLKNGVWDYYAEYQTLCKTCSNLPRYMGIYYGENKYTDNIQTKEMVVCYCKISTHEELTKFVSTVSKTTKAILFNDIRVDNLDILEDLHELECVIISYCPKLNSFWNFERTPRLKVLKYQGNRHFIDITQIEKAINLEYFEIDVLTSQSNLNFIQSFESLTKLKKLKEVVLRGVMCLDNNIDSLINISNLEKLWISPNTFSLDDFAKFESLKFKIFEEYGIFQNGDFSCPLGKGGRVFRSEKSKEAFKQKYYDIMSIYKKQ